MRFAPWLLLACTACGSDVSVPHGEVPEPACAWTAREAVTIAAPSVEGVTLVPSRDGATVALVVISGEEGVLVARWGWDEEPGALGVLVPAPALFPVVGEGPDDTVGVAALDGWEGPHRVVDEAMGEVASLGLAHEQAFRYLGASREGARLAMTAGPGPVAQLDVAGGGAVATVGCEASRASVIERPEELVVAATVPRSVEACDDEGGRDRALEVMVVSDGEREVTHVVALEDEATGPAEHVRLLPVGEGVALVYGTRPVSYGYGELPLTHWLVPLSRGGEAQAEAVEVPLAAAGAVAAVGEDVVMVHGNADGFGVGFVEPDGTIGASVPLPMDDLLVGAGLSVALGSNGTDRLMAAVAADGAHVQLHGFACVAK